MTNGRFLNNVNGCIDRVVTVGDGRFLALQESCAPTSTSQHVVDKDQNKGKRSQSTLLESKLTVMDSFDR